MRRAAPRVQGEARREETRAPGSGEGAVGPAAALAAPVLFDALLAERGPAAAAEVIQPAAFPQAGIPFFRRVLGAASDLLRDLRAEEAGLLQAKGGPSVELLAGFLSALDLARQGPGRVRMPVPVPQGVAGAWTTGLRTLRDGVFRERPARANQWLATDGWTEMTLTADLNREGAVRSLDRQVRRECPFPKRPQPPMEPPPEPSIEQSQEENRFSIRATVRGPESDVRWVDPTPENTPVVVLKTGAVPERALPAGWHWGWVFGACGNPLPSAMLWQPKGITVVGDRLLEVLDMNRLEDLLAEADRTAPPRPVLPPEVARTAPPADNRCRTYRLADEKTGTPVRPAVIQSSWGSGFHAGTLDGDLHRRTVLRQRILPG